MSNSIESSSGLIGSKRISAYSVISSAPSSAPSTVTTTIIAIDERLRRLDDLRFVVQRFIPSEQKTEVLSKLALGAKLERALSRRITNQDYTPRAPVKAAKAGCLHTYL